METNFQFLLCGYNGSGFAFLWSAERKVREEIKVINRVLINAGDGVQRICIENKIKLFTLSTIIITSISPQNLSGFPGLFLALSDLGVGEITVYGPPGLQLVLNLMHPFINRKHPVMKVIEVEERRTERVKGSSIEFIPLTAEESTKAIAIACAFTPMDDLSFSFDDNTFSSKICILPVPVYFSVSPSLETCTQEFLTNIDNRNCLVFLPLSVDSQPVHQQSMRSLFHEFSMWNGSKNRLREQLLHLCDSSNSFGLLMTASVHSDVSEFKFSQWGVFKRNLLANPLFPGPLYSENSSTVLAPESSDLYVVLPLAKVVFAKRENERSNESVTSFQMIWHQNIDGEHVNTFYQRADMFQRKLQQLQDIEISLPVTSSSKASDGICMVDLLDDTLRVESSPVPKMTNNYDAAAKLKAQLLSKRKYSNSSTNRDCLPPFSPKFPSSPAFYQAPLSHSLQPTSLRQRERSDSSYLSELPDTPNGLYSSGPSTFESTITTITNRSDSVMSVGIGSGYDREGKVTSHPSEMYGMESPLKIMRITPKRDTLWSPNAQPSINQRSFFQKETTFEEEGSVIENEDQELEITIERNGEDGNETASQGEEDRPVSKQFHTNRDQSQIVRLKQLLLLLHSQIPPPNPSQDLFHITFLGTGCATPSKYRNSSAILIKLLPNPSSLSHQFNSSTNPTITPIMLLDVGEGTVSQIYQSVSGSLERFDEILLNIRVVWISHHHADHATGLPLLISYIRKAKLRQERKLAEERQKQLEMQEETGKNDWEYNDQKSKPSSNPFQSNNKTNKFPRKSLSLSINTTSSALNSLYEEGKVLIIAPEKVLKYYEEFLKLSNLQSLITGCPITHTLYAGMTTDIQRATNGIIQKIQSIPVIHCQNAFGLVLEFSHRHDSSSDEEGFGRPYRLVYSGDCRPSQSLIKAGQYCDLLIHEATFTHEKITDAVKKKHSTVDEAILTAVRMKAKHLILTHFSQRYPVAHAASLTSSNPFHPVPSLSLPTPNSIRSDESLNGSYQSRSEMSMYSNSHRHKSEAVPTFSAIDLVQIQNYKNVSFAYDLLKICFPSQIEVLPQVTKALSGFLNEFDEWEG